MKRLVGWSTKPLSLWTLGLGSEFSRATLFVTHKPLANEHSCEYSLTYTRASTR